MSTSVLVLIDFVINYSVTSSSGYLWVFSFAVKTDHHSSCQETADLEQPLRGLFESPDEEVFFYTFKFPCCFGVKIHESWMRKVRMMYVYL